MSQSKLKVKFKKSHPDSKLPTKATEYAAGWDLYAYFHNEITKWVIPPGERLLVPVGFSMEIPEGFEAQIRPRSGLAFKEGLVACFGTIDSDYRGVVSVNIFNHSYKSAYVEHGQRVGQMVFQPVLQVELIESLELSDTQRGSNGFGSTGK